VNFILHGTGIVWQGNFEDGDRAIFVCVYNNDEKGGSFDMVPPFLTSFIQYPA
jgi:hypothetical protein